MRVKVLSDRFVGGAVGDVVDVDPERVSVRTLVRARIVEVVPEKKKPTKKKADR